MSPKEWILKYGNLGSLVRDRRVLFYATTATMIDMSDRIWKDGGLTDGGKLTYKEDYEVYVTKPPFPKKGNGKGKTGKKIKTGWAPTYLAAKAQQGRADFPFELTGDLRKDWLGGAVAEPREINPLLCVIELNDANAKKAEGLAEQKGEFLGLTSKEKEQHANNVRRTYRELVLGQAA